MPFDGVFRRLPRAFWPATFGALLLLQSPGLMCAAEPPIRVLLVSGQNNHDWKATTPVLKAILERGGRFVVEVREHPEAFDEATYEKYDVLVSNWNSFGLKNSDWPAPVRDAFIRFIREGHGFVVVHSGSSSFPDWRDYHLIAGGAWGEGTGHGPVHNFEVKIADPEHPITRGLAPFRTTDELWHRAWSIADRHVLATAFSAKDKGGSGADEPVAFTTAFGKGRCFNLVLGHDTRAMESQGFQALLRRGTEWAATSKVTLTDASAQAAAAPEALLAAAAQYRFGDSRAPLAAVERLVAASSMDPAVRKKVASLLEAMLSAECSMEAKQFFCTQLSLIGTAAEVPALARLLGDTNFAFQARLALERIPGSESLGALMGALATASGRQRVGLINSLGARRDPAAIENLASLALSPEPATATAALMALGAFGTQPAAQALIAADAKIPASFKPATSEAMLRCGESMLRAGAANESLSLLRRLVDPARPPRVRLAASALLLSAPGAASAPVLTTLQSGDRVLRSSAVLALRKLSNPVALADAAALLPKLPPETQVELLGLFADQPGPGCLAAATGALASDSAEVRQSALAAVAVLGDATSGPVLASLLADAKGEEKTAITEALTRLPAVGVDEALAESLKGATAGAARDLLRALVNRGGPLALSVVLTQLDHPDPQVRREATAGMGKLAKADSVGPLLERLDKTPAGEIEAIQSAIAEICKREGIGQQVVAALTGAGPGKQVLLLEILASIGGPQALEEITRRAKGSEEAVRAVAVRLLGDWPEPAALGALREIAASAPDEKTKAIALRGVARLTAQTKERPEEQIVQRLTFGGYTNLSLGATASNPDGLAPDGEGGPPASAIDGDARTYWDEVDNRSRYAIRIKLKQPAQVALLRILGWKQHEFAPKDFEVLCDGRSVKKVQNAQYEDNWLTVTLPQTQCATVELSITGYYGLSPAIRELELYGSLNQSGN